MASRTDPRPAKRQRTKCFTGCWTCRARHVKCDERQPLCQRCEQFGIACEGYGVRLNWSRSTADQADDDGPPQTHGPSRRTLGKDVGDMFTGLSSAELDEILGKIDSGSSASSTTDGASFSVFSVRAASVHAPYCPSGQSHTPAATSPVGDSDPSSCPRSPPSSEVPLPISTQHVEQPFPSGLPRLGRSYEEAQATTSNQIALPSHENIGNIRYTGLPQASENAAELSALLTVARKDATQERTVSPSLENTAPVVERRGHRDNVSDDRSYAVTLVATPAPPNSLSHLDLLSCPAQQKRLIHHWVTFTSRKMVLLDEPHNPCRTMMLPMALEGLTLTSDICGANIAIFHAVCACAAYNLFELGGRKSEQDQSLGLNHGQQAIAHLRHSLAQVDDLRDQSLAMAIMACIAVEAISGTPRRWRTHVTGGLAYLGKLHSRGLISQVSPAFQQHMVSMAIMCGFPVMPELKAFLIDTTNLELSFPYYGTSASFLRAHDHINTLATSKTPLNSRELDLFELKLYLDFPTTTYASSNSTSKDVVHHVAKSFYYAGLVYFQRTIQGAPLEDVQALVKSGVEELEAIELLGKDSFGSMMMWPALILAADCASEDLQNRMQSWSRSKQKLGFRNVVVLHDLATAVWALRASTSSDVRWQDLIVDERFDVFML